MAYKSELNEWCQRHQKQFPFYQSYEEDPLGQYHQFRGKCIFEDNKFVTKKLFITKKAADNAVAKLILEHIKKDVNTNTLQHKYYLFIDLDNQNIKSCIDILVNNENINVVGIGGPRAIIPKIDCLRFELWRTDLITKDAADIELAFRLGCLYDKIPKETKIIVFSTDYALDALAKIMTRYGYDAKFETSLDLLLQDALTF